MESSDERYVKETLDALAGKGKTVIIIAHRLTTVRCADNIVVIDKGKVAETGTHSQLYDAGGPYFRLWNEQFAMFE